jgi:putative CocE/NonD family hydrolase
VTTPAVVRQRNLVAVMSDGTHLVADAWRPAEDGRFPVLLQRLPYGRSVASAPVLPSPEHLARLGYAVVVQDVRGRGDSDGTWVPFVHEASDGAETVEWAASLPFSDGRVVTYGFSYQGLNQLLAAARRPRGLVGIAPMMCAADARGMVAEGGAIMWEATAPWAAQLATSEMDNRARSADLLARPLRQAIGADAPSWYADWVERPDDDEYWVSLAADLNAIDVPAFTVVGCADSFAAANVRWLPLLDVEAVLGPWGHMPWGTTLGSLDLEDANPKVATSAFLGFLARVLGGSEERPSARYYAVGLGWKAAATFPPPGEPWVLYARSSGDANSRYGGGELVEADTGVDLGDVIVSEPLVPYPASGTPFPDVRSSEERRDVLVYTSFVVDEHVLFAGSPVVVVRLTADGPCIDLVAALVFVSGGSAIRAAHGIARLGDVDADRPKDVVVTLGPIAWNLGPDDAVRLDLSCTASPLYAVNPQTELKLASAARRGEYVVRAMHVHAASLQLPMVSS